VVGTGERVPPGVREQRGQRLHRVVHPGWAVLAVHDQSRHSDLAGPGGGQRVAPLLVGHDRDVVGRGVHNRFQGGPRRALPHLRDGLVGQPDGDLHPELDRLAATARAGQLGDPGGPDVTIGMHICRGNNRSAWMARGSYEPVAERLFGEVGVDRFLLEYDTERAGGFAPLRFIRPGTTVVLGLVSSKLPQLESPDELRRRIDEAARYVPIADLALSPQCGFASTSGGNQLTVDEERCKLELVASTASRIWA
jgi:hypothetical protein